MICEEDRKDSFIARMVEEFFNFLSIYYVRLDRKYCYDFEFSCTKKLKDFGGIVQIGKGIIRVDVKSTIRTDENFHRLLELINIIKGEHCESHFYIDLEKNVVASVVNLNYMDTTPSRDDIDMLLLTVIVLFKAFTPGFSNVAAGIQMPMEAYEDCEDLLDAFQEAVRDKVSF